MTPERWQKVKEVLAIVLEAPPSRRTSCLDEFCGDDVSFRSEVELLLSQEHQVRSQFLNKTDLAMAAAAALMPETDTPSVGRQIGVYKILERIASGGMGEVYRAIRTDGVYDKQVAVKVVRHGFDVGSLIERFYNERRILASLEHSNIARLLDGGSFDDGIPYLVMELIEGERIDIYCDHNNLTIAERLQLFRQVCSAVHYAHKRLVIHRDIKPSNILITKDGCPKLLDFGIAKILTPTADAEAALTLTQAMTPEYASPEQVRGESVTTATDVYSLGVVLYRLLTGRSPYPMDTRSPHKLALAVCETEPARPSSVVSTSDSDSAEVSCDFAFRVGENTPARLQRRLAGDLDNVVLMALRKEPERRYSSAEQLAEDLRRHVEGLPVIATKGSWLYRAGKFTRRHKVIMAASVAVFLALAVGIMVTVREARIAQHQATIAEMHKRRAEKRFNDVRKLSDSLIFDVHDAIRDLPGSTPARKLLLDRALEYLDSVAKDADDDPNLQRELAKGYQRLAAVQGDAVQSNLGDAEGADATERKALALFEDVAKANPNDANDQLNVAVMYRILSFNALNNASGQRDLEHAIAVTDRILKNDPSNPAALSESAIQQQNIAFTFDFAGDRSRALDAYRKDYEVRAGLWKIDPGRRSNRHGMGITMVMLGEALAHMGSREEGLKFIEQGIGHYESLVKDTKGTDEQRELWLSRQKRADILFMNGDSAGALAAYREAHDGLQAMAKADPQNTMVQVDLANMSYYQGRAFAVLGREVEARKYLQNALDLFEKFKNAAISSDQYPLGPAASNIWLGDLSTRQSDYLGALRRYKAALALLGTVPSSDLEDDQRCEMATALVRTGRVSLHLGNPREALASFQKALDTAQPELAVQHNDVYQFYPISEAQAGQGEANNALARLAQNSEERNRLLAAARRAYQQSSETWRRIPNPSHISASLFLFDGPPPAFQN
jgi:eukaryotic-like serine/threonine-protein kinase